MTDFTWTPSLSGGGGGAYEKGLNTTNSSYATLQVDITAGNPMIGKVLKEVQITWLSDTSSPASGTWKLSHYQGGILKETTNTIATPPTSSGTQVFDANFTNNIASGDYFTLVCDETNDSNRNPKFPTEPTCTGDCQWSCTRKTDNADFNYVPSTWTYSDGSGPGADSVLLPPEPAMVRI